MSSSTSPSARSWAPVSLNDSDACTCSIGGCIVVQVNRHRGSNDVGHKVGDRGSSQRASTHGRWNPGCVAHLGCLHQFVPTHIRAWPDPAWGFRMMQVGLCCSDAAVLRQGGLRPPPHGAADQSSVRNSTARHRGGTARHRTHLAILARKAALRASRRSCRKYISCAHANKEGGRSYERGK